MLVQPSRRERGYSRAGCRKECVMHAPGLDLFEDVADSESAAEILDLVDAHIAQGRAGTLASAESVHVVHGDPVQRFGLQPRPPGGSEWATGVFLGEAGVCPPSTDAEGDPCPAQALPYTRRYRGRGEGGGESSFFYLMRAKNLSRTLRYLCRQERSPCRHSHYPS